MPARMWGSASSGPCHITYQAATVRWAWWVQAAWESVADSKARTSSWTASVVGYSLMGREGADDRLLHGAEDDGRAGADDALDAFELFGEEVVEGVGVGAAGFEEVVVVAGDM